MNNRLPQTDIPSRDSTTNLQMSTLLGALATVVNGIIAINHSEQVAETSGSPGTKRDGGVLYALETTVIEITNRMDKMVADEKRWSIDGQEKLQEALTNAYQSADKLQKLSALPHHRFKPTLMRMPDGMWIAILGSLDDLNNSVVGIGEYPAQALSAFDDLFNGVVSPELLARLMTREQAILAGSEPPPFNQPPTPTPTPNNEISRVDTGRSSNPKKPARKNPRAANRKKTRKNV